MLLTNVIWQCTHTNHLQLKAMIELLIFFVLIPNLSLCKTFTGSKHHLKVTVTYVHKLIVLNLYHHNYSWNLRSIKKISNKISLQITARYRMKPLAREITKFAVKIHQSRLPHPLSDIPALSGESINALKGGPGLARMGR